MENTKVQIAVPTRESVYWKTATRLNQVRDLYPGLPPIRYMPGHTSVAVTRNLIIEEFLEGDAEVLVMVDDDTVPESNFLDLVCHLQKDLKLGMVGAVVPIAIPGRVTMNVARINPEAQYEWDLERGYGLVEYDAIGTACVAIRRGVLKRLPTNPFTIAYTEDGRMHGSDFRFFERLIATGYKVAADWSVFADHYVRDAQLQHWHDPIAVHAPGI